MIRKIASLVSNLLGANSGDDFRSPRTPLLLAFIDEGPNDWHSTYQKLKDWQIGREILAASPQEQKEIALDLAGWLILHEAEEQAKRKTQGYYESDYRIHRIKNSLIELLRKKLPITEDELTHFIRWSLTYDSNYWRAIPQIIKQVQDFQKEKGLPERLKKLINNYIRVLTDTPYGVDATTRQQVAKLQELAGNSARNPLVAGEAWSDHARERIEKLADAKRASWIELLNICAAARGSAPTAKWATAAELALKKVGVKSFKKEILTWFPLVDRPRTQRIEHWSEWSPDPNGMLNDHNADVLKGLIWTAAKHVDENVLRAISALALSAYKKVPGAGPRCVRLGNACVWLLGETRNSAAIGHLAVLKSRIKGNSVQAVIGKALDKAASRSGLTRDEIEEMSVPTFGLTEVGYMSESLGDYSAVISVKGTDEVSLSWLGPADKTIKSTPSAVKEKFAEDLKELTQSVKDIRQMLSAQRDRIDSIYLEQKSWSYDTWRERYLDHPLVGTIARRLIWRFTDAGGSTSAIWYEKGLVTAFGEPVDPAEATTVELWHPLHEATDDVLQWREFLEEHSIRQPFKQAHREIYLLTDAERTTNVYSNRYAAHILKQHQFNALCSARGWRNQLRLLVDAEVMPPTRQLPKWNLRAEFWVEGIGENYEVDTNATGTFFYLSTDQVRFYPIDSRENLAHAGGGGYGLAVRGGGVETEPQALDTIPELVFSEIMRDIDLFVGVASVGNDPNWLDSGADANQRNYWYEYSFGDLSVSASMRKEMLQKLVRKLKIADRCSFEDKFLVVRGDVRTYKIHLGSGNILMKPNDQYLCIVPKQATTASDNKLFLPFEGDQRVAVILSKAFLLADDTKIDDPTILRQIRLG